MIYSLFMILASTISHYDIEQWIDYTGDDNSKSQNGNPDNRIFKHHNVAML